MAEAPAVKGEAYVFPDEKDASKIVLPEETDIEIEIVDDTPESDRGYKPGASKDVGEVSDEELAVYSGNVQKRIKELSFARHDERRAKEQAVREREELERVTRTVLDENNRLKTYVHTGEQVYAGTAKAAATAKLEIVKKKLKEAHEAFDTDAIVASQQEMYLAQMELTQAENFRPTPLQQYPASVYSQPSGQQSPEPDEKASRWQQRNKWFGSDDEMTALALVAHKRLVETGIDPQSDEYYKRIDARIREKFPENFGDEPHPAPAPQRKSAYVVAPTTRSGSSRKVVLTQTQVALAKKFGLSNEEYAKHVALLET